MPRKKQVTDDSPKCGACEYFMGEPRADEGRCRRYPPSIILSGENLVFLQPVVEVDGWCAEFRRRVS